MVHFPTVDHDRTHITTFGPFQPHQGTLRWGSPVMPVITVIWGKGWTARAPARVDGHTLSHPVEVFTQPRVVEAVLFSSSAGRPMRAPGTDLQLPPNAPRGTSRDDRIARLRWRPDKTRVRLGKQTRRRPHVIDFGVGPDSRACLLSMGLSRFPCHPLSSYPSKSAVRRHKPPCSLLD